MFRKTLIAAAAALTLSTGAAFAQAAAPAPAVAAEVGSFLYNQDGVAMGSLHAIHGDQAVLWIGFFNTPGNHFVTVPASDVAQQGGRLVLNAAGANQLAAR